MGCLNQNDDNDDTFRRGWGVWDLDDYIMTQHDKVSAAMIYHPLLILCFLSVTLLASTNLSIIAMDYAILCHMIYVIKCHKTALHFIYFLEIKFTGYSWILEFLPPAIILICCVMMAVQIFPLKQ